MPVADGSGFRSHEWQTVECDAVVEEVVHWLEEWMVERYLELDRDEHSKGAQNFYFIHPTFFNCSSFRCSLSNVRWSLVNTSSQFCSEEQAVIRPPMETCTMPWMERQLLEKYFYSRWSTKMVKDGKDKDGAQRKMTHFLFIFALFNSPDHWTRTANEWRLTFSSVATTSFPSPRLFHFEFSTASFNARLVTISLERSWTFN